MQEIAERPPAVSARVRIGVLIGAIVFFLLFDFALGWLRSWGDRLAAPFVAGLLSGVFACQGKLLAFGIACGPGRMIVRAPWMLLGLMLVVFLELLGISITATFDMVQGKVINHVVQYFFTCGIIAICFGAYRMVSGCRLTLGDEENAPLNKFHLQQLLLGMAPLGIAFALLRSLGNPMDGIRELDGTTVAWLTVLAGVSFAIGLPSLLYAFRSKAIGCAGLIAVGLWCVVATILEGVAFWFAVRPDYVAVMTMCYWGTINITTGFGMIVLARLIRRAGYELRGGEGNESPEPAAEMATVIAVAADPWSEDES